MFRTRLVLETMRVLGVAPEPKGISDSRPSFALLGWGILCSIANDTVRSQRGQAACFTLRPRSSSGPLACALRQYIVTKPWFLKI